MTPARSAARWLSVVPAVPGAMLLAIGILWTEIPQLAAGAALLLVSAVWWRLFNGRAMIAQSGSSRIRNTARWAAVIPGAFGLEAIVLATFIAELWPLGPGVALAFVAAAWWRIVGGRWRIRGEQSPVAAPTL